MDSNASQSFAFILVGEHGEPSPTDRQLIRRHCMNGKNLRIGVKPVPHPLPWEDERTDDQIVSASIAQDATTEPSDTAGEAVEGLAEAKLPPPTPSDLSLFKFAGEVDSHSRMLIFNCTYHRVPSDSLL
jgi:hypothetical protein